MTGFIGITVCIDALLAGGGMLQAHQAMYVVGICLLGVNILHMKDRMQLLYAPQVDCVYLGH